MYRFLIVSCLMFQTVFTWTTVACAEASSADHDEARR